MPEYSYRCRVCAGVFNVVRAMAETRAEYCPVCGGECQRLYHAPRVNWNGLAPSQGELHPEVREHIEHRQERREQFEAMHAEHEARAQKENV